MELVIFKSPIMCVTLGVILLLHVAVAVVPTFLKSKVHGRVAIYVTSALILCLHGVIFAWALINSASVDELLLVLTASCAVGLVSMGITEKTLKEKKGKKEEE